MRVCGPPSAKDPLRIDPSPSRPLPSPEFTSCRRYLAQRHTAASPAGTDAVGARGRPARTFSDLVGLAVACPVRLPNTTHTGALRTRSGCARAVAIDRAGSASRRSMAQSDRHRLLAVSSCLNRFLSGALPVEGRSERPDRGRRARSSMAVSCWTPTLPRPAGPRERHPALAAPLRARKCCGDRERCSRRGRAAPTARACRSCRADPARCLAGGAAIHCSTQRSALAGAGGAPARGAASAARTARGCRRARVRRLEKTRG
jgi:hypothetical protein